MTDNKYPADIIETVASRIEGSALMGESFEQQAVAALDALDLEVTKLWGVKCSHGVSTWADEADARAELEVSCVGTTLVQRTRFGFDPILTDWVEVPDAD